MLVEYSMGKLPRTMKKWCQLKKVLRVFLGGPLWECLNYTKSKARQTFLIISKKIWILLLGMNTIREGIYVTYF
jgi:hypothetical protein